MSFIQAELISIDEDTGFPKAAYRAIVHDNHQSICDEMPAATSTPTGDKKASQRQPLTEVDKRERAETAKAAIPADTNEQRRKQIESAIDDYLKLPLASQLAIRTYLLGGEDEKVRDTDKQLTEVSEIADHFIEYEIIEADIKKKLTLGLPRPEYRCLLDDEHHDEHQHHYTSHLSLPRPKLENLISAEA